MESVKLANNLNNRKVSIQEILEIIKIADIEEQYNLSKKLNKTISDNYPYYFFEIKNPFIEEVPTGLLGAFEIDDIQEETGLNGSINSKEIYNLITKKIIKIIETKNDIKYVQKWKSKYLIALNFKTKKPYRGANQIILGGIAGDLNNPYYLTKKQIEKLGGKIKEKAETYDAVFYNFLYAKDNIRSCDKIKFIESTGLSTDEINKYKIPFIKLYKLYNGEDIEGIDFKLENATIGKVEEEKDVTNEIEFAKLIIDNYPKPQPTYKEKGSSAFYSPSSDIVNLPKKNNFESIQDYYRTLFHEYAHSTGNKNRLNRDFSGKFGSKAYAFEELVAEFGATFLSAQAGIIWYNTDNHAAYIKSWNKKLTFIKNDSRFLLKAASKAQQLTDFILQPNENGVPLFLQNYNKETKKEVKPTEKKVVKPVVKPTEKKVVKPVVKPTEKKVVKPVVKPTVKKVIESTKEPKTRTTSSVIEVPIKSINIDKTRFQNRNSLNETVLNQIVKNFSEVKMDPIMLWKDKNNKIYLLAGHHRLEATKRKEKTHIQSKFFVGTEQEAIHYAKVESNANRSLETPQERAKIYRDMLKKGTKKEVIEKAKEIEGKNASYIINLAYLNPTGLVMQMLQSFDKNTDQSTEKELAKIADWIGNARQNYNLTDAHETEMFQFLKDASLSARIKTKVEFLQKINAIVSAFDFDKNQVLNLKRFKYKTDGESKYEEEYNQIKNQIDTILAKKQDITDRVKNPKNPKYINPKSKDYEEVLKQLDKVMQNYNNDLKYYQNNLIQLMQDKGNYINAGSNQVALFGPKKTTTQLLAPNGKPSNLTAKQWKQVRTPAFKKWFGDWENNPKNASKVVDENGEPMVVYHGTDSKFNEFDKNKQKNGHLGKGFYFAQDKKNIKGFGKKNIATFLNSKNPFLTDNNFFNIGIELELQKKGFDGIHLTDWDNGNTFSVFSPNQIKSATDNVGTFDASKNSILQKPALKGIKTTQLLAPNGKPSNLTEKQWKQVRTSAFKKWFGDWENDPKNASKVVDENGEPMVVYHGTDAEFNEFSLDYYGKNGVLSGKGYNFATDKKIAEYYSKQNKGKIIESFINLRNPYDYNILKKNNPELLNKIMNEEGHFDDILFNNKFDGKYEKGDKTLLVYSPNQIKSATDNVGTFDASKNSILQKPATAPTGTLANIMNNQKNKEVVYYENGSVELAKFLGDIEIKDKESVAITIAGGQGSGKTRFVFQMINAFAKYYKVAHLSLEEHPESSLYTSKAQEYINPSYYGNISVLQNNSLQAIDKIIQNNEVIVIDSFQKLQEIQKGLELDKDFRKKYNGKLFIIIYQLTSNGSMRGGTKSQFDGDVILMTKKNEDYRKSYIYADKNRYTKTPLNELKYNIFNKKFLKNTENE